MKRILSFVALLALGAFSAVAADQTWTGTISDSMCGANHKKMTEHGTTKMSDRDCALACVKNGGKYVFVSKGKVYNIDNQEYAGLEEHAGHTVRLTGEMKGDTVKVTNITMPGKAKKTS
jgi:opacity protein-like surface antigen